MASLKAIKASLIEQLERKGADVAVFIDQIDSYIFCKQYEKEMQKDIRKKGLSYKAISATGKEYIKENPSVKNFIMYNKQGLEILTKLGLTTKSVEVECDDEL